jgi:hypothetical protein
MDKYGTTLLETEYGTYLTNRQLRYLTQEGIPNKWTGTGYLTQDGITYGQVRYGTLFKTE